MARTSSSLSLVAVAAAAAMLLFGNPSSVAAQSSKQPSTQGAEQPAGHGPDARNSGTTAPDSQPGTTGMAAPTETTGSGNNINNDSYYATGSDLKGPAVQFFPASKTPE
jgi:hypothetical protein